MRLCLNMLIFTHNLGNWLISSGDMDRQIFAAKAKVKPILGIFQPHKFFVQAGDAPATISDC